MMPHRMPGATAPVSGHGHLHRPRQVRYGKAVISAVLHTHLVHSLLDARLCELRFASAQAGRRATVPVEYVRCGDELAVLVDAADGSRWWRPFTMPYPVHVLLRRRWYQGLARALEMGQPGWQRARAAYAERLPAYLLSDSDIYLLIGLRPGTGRPCPPVVRPDADA